MGAGSVRYPYRHATLGMYASFAPRIPCRTDGVHFCCELTLRKSLHLRYENYDLDAFEF